MSIYCSLPRELMIDIFFRLSIKSLLRFRLVSKSWRDFLDSKEFIDMQSSRFIKTGPKAHKLLIGFVRGHCLCSYRIFSASLNDDTASSPDNNLTATFEELYNPFEDINVIGTCNSLVCIKKKYYHGGRCRGGRGLVLFNPWTRKDWEVPQPPRFGDFGDKRLRWGDPPKYIEVDIIYGFGYDYVNDDYKVVRLVGFPWWINTLYSDLEELNLCEVQIYSLKSNSWKRSQKLRNNFAKGVLGNNTNGGVLVNHSLHWIREERGGDALDIILAIDIRTGKYRSIPFPPEEGEDNRGRGGVVTEVNGRLSVIRTNISDKCEIWMMKNYGIKDSWSKIDLVLSRYLLHSPIAYSDHDKQQLIFFDDDGKLYVYSSDKKKERWSTKVRFPGSGKLIIEVRFCVPSLFRPCPSGNGNGNGSEEMRKDSFGQTERIASPEDEKSCKKRKTRN